VILRTPWKKALPLIAGTVVVLSLFVWWFQFGPGVGFEPGYPGGRYSRGVALAAAWLGFALLSLLLMGALAARFALLVGDLKGVRFVGLFGLSQRRGWQLNGDLSGAILIVTPVNPVKGRQQMRITVSARQGSISRVMDAVVLGEGYQERFDAWKADWVAHHSDAQSL
jgi:hypothetical protein